MLTKSKYNYFFKRNDSTWGCFNTLTGSLILLNDQEKKAFDFIDYDPAAFDIKQLSLLEEFGFLIEEDFDEQALIDFSRKKRVYLNNAAYFRILTTTKCNARCYYCYENGLNINSMTLETAEYVKKFVLKNKSLKKLYIHWFGGEPLENIEIIDFVMPALIEEFKRSNCIMHVMITSNASLLTPEIVRKAKYEWQVETFQITIDDLGVEYDKVKKYISISNAFEKVLSNIKLLLEIGIKINLRINFRENEVNKIDRVTRFFLEKYITYYNAGLLEFFPGPIFDVSSNCKLCSAYNKNNNKTVYANKIIEDICLEKSLKINSNFFNVSFKAGQCYACHFNSFVIDPLGNLFKCSLTLNDSKACIGSVKNGIIPNTEYFKWVNAELPEKCYKCLFLPLCQGGCKAGYLGYVEHHCNNLISELNEYLEYKIVHQNRFSLQDKSNEPIL